MDNINKADYKNFITLQKDYHKLNKLCKETDYSKISCDKITKQFED